MNPQQMLMPLIQQLDILTQVVTESPYISREGRLWISKEIDKLFLKLKEGEVSFVQGEKTLTDLNKQAAADEISTLLLKIRELNPSSPRVENLRSIKNALNADEISPEQARQRLQELMHA